MKKHILTSLIVLTVYVFSLASPAAIETTIGNNQAQSVTSDLDTNPVITEGPVQTDPENPENNILNTTQPAQEVQESGSDAEEEDAEANKDTYPSLADYVMDLLTNSNNTGTPQPQFNGFIPDFNASIVNASSTGNQTGHGEYNSEAQPATGTTLGSNNNTGIDSYNWDEEFDNYDDDYDEDEWGDDQWNSSEDTNSTSTVNDCQSEVRLGQYCQLPQSVNDYFSGNLTARNLLLPFIDMNIIDALMGCPRGEWCLKEGYEVLNHAADIFEGPLCGEALWECIFDIMVQREQCADKEFMFIVDAVDMVCNLFEQNPASPSELACFTHALGALHVTYADFLSYNMNDEHPVEGVVCYGYAFRMTKTYLCADEFCMNFFETRRAMEHYNRWSWFMGMVEETDELCDLNNVCGPLQPSAVFEPRSMEPLPMEPLWTTSTTFSYLWTDPNAPPPTDNGYDQPGQGESDDIDALRKEGESMMMALVVATVVALMFMVLGLIYWRRNRRRGLYYNRGTSFAPDGYDKVASDEARLLSSSSD